MPLFSGIEKTTRAFVVRMKCARVSRKSAALDPLAPAREAHSRLLAIYYSSQRTFAIRFRPSVNFASHLYTYSRFLFIIRDRERERVCIFRLGQMLFVNQRIYPGTYKSIIFFIRPRFICSSIVCAPRVCLSALRLIYSCEQIYYPHTRQYFFSLLLRSRVI